MSNPRGYSSLARGSRGPRPLILFGACSRLPTRWFSLRKLRSTYSPRPCFGLPWDGEADARSRGRWAE